MSVLHIAGREMAAAFRTPVGWLVLCGWLFVCGFFWSWSVEIYVVDSQDLVFNPYAGASLNLTDHLLVPYFTNLSVLLLFVLPAITMRSFAQERARRTLELLFTSPVSTAEIVLGKYLGAMGIAAVLLGVTLPYPLLLFFWGTPDPGVIAGGQLGLLLHAGLLAALGVLLSSITESQLTALVLTFSAGLVLMLADGRGGDPDAWTSHLSLANHLSSLLRGAVRLSDVAYFVLATAWCLVATHQRLESFRWS